MFDLDRHETIHFRCLAAMRCGAKQLRQHAMMPADRDASRGGAPPADLNMIELRPGASQSPRGGVGDAVIEKKK